MSNNEEFHFSLETSAYARHHPRPQSRFIRDFVEGRRVHAGDADCMGSRRVAETKRSAATFNLSFMEKL